MRHLLCDSAFSYVWWIEELEEVVLSSPYQGLVMTQLPPAQQDETYLRQLDNCMQQCATNSAGNTWLNQVIFSSVDNRIANLVTYLFACENLEAIKNHFSSCMDPFRILLLERSVIFNRKNVLDFYTKIDAMTKMYRYAFGISPANSLVVLWMMSSLSNDALNNADVLGEIHQNWPKVHDDPLTIRRIINSHLQHAKQHGFQEVISG